jgi:hypothetical protein
MVQKLLKEDENMDMLMHKAILDVKKELLLLHVQEWGSYRSFNDDFKNSLKIFLSPATNFDRIRSEIWTDLKV